MTVMQPMSEMDFVKAALGSLRHCAVRAEHHVPTWFVPSFNNWYCQAVRNGYRGSMATVFDLGLIIVQPGVALADATAKRDEGQAWKTYLRWLHQLSASPLMEVVRDVVTGAPDGTRPQVEWILVESLLRHLRGVWEDVTPGVKPVPRYLPYLEAIGGHALVRRVSDRASLGQVGLSVPDAEDQIPVTHPQPTTDVEPNELPDRLRLFMAHVASHSPNAVDLLDYEVVEACLHGPNLRTEQHEPPPQHRTELETRTRSNVPGPIAGVTRVEVRQPEDSILDVLPSELVLLMADERAGMAHLLNGRPLVFKHENQKDLVPEHRALVCFVVAAGAEGPAQLTGGSVHAYRHPYVFAKRQVFDLLCDLREALRVVRAIATVEIDVGIFALREVYDAAVVHSRFALDGLMPRETGHVLQDRFRQLASLNHLVPGFFDRLTPGRRRPHAAEEDSVSWERVDPDVGRFLQREVRRAKPYHAIHLVPIGTMRDIVSFLATIRRYYHFSIAAHQQLMMIAVDPTLRDPDQRLAALTEPQWLCGQVRTLNEAMGLLSARRLRLVTLERLRRLFVSSVIGEATKKAAGIQRLVRLA